jgi:hypothetical protein
MTMSDVQAYIDAIEPESKRSDSATILQLMQEITGEEPTMWGSIVGFGSYHYVYESGREGDWFLSGFAARKKALTLYIVAGLERYEALLSRLGKHKTGKSCLYIKKLEDVDMDVLRDLITRSVADVQAEN